jgi:hypothetical protein
MTPSVRSAGLVCVAGCRLQRRRRGSEMEGTTGERGSQSRRFTLDWRDLNESTQERLVAVFAVMMPPKCIAAQGRSIDMERPTRMEESGQSLALTPILALG